MVNFWVILSTKWKLEDVQAALNVIISLLCVIAVFTSARFFWHTSARRISRNDQVPISSLLSFTTIGEALDVIILLKSRLFHATHARLAVQCLLVIIFSVSAIFAGPISRFSTRVGQTLGVRPVKGLLASKSWACDINNYVRWHDISSALDKANFPRDQLPDFLPNLDQDYVYSSADWNSSYSASCKSTYLTKITLNATGNYTDRIGYLYDEVPGLYDILSPRFQANYSNLWIAYTGSTDPSKEIWPALSMFQYAELRPDDDWNFDNTSTERMSISIAAIGMKDAPLYQPLTDSDFDYGFGIGEIPDAWYTKVECDFTRSRPITEETDWETNLDLSGTCNPAQEMTTFFAASILNTQADHSVQVNIPSGDELFRFYQSWTIAKDTHFPTSVVRDLHVRLRTVELSIVFIAVASLIIVVVLIGFVHCLVAHFNYRDVYSRIPETKVDWLLQSLREAEGKEGSDATILHGEKEGAIYAPRQKSRVVSSAVATSSDDEADAEYQPYDPANGESISRGQSRREHLRRMPWEQAHYTLIPQSAPVNSTKRPDDLHMDSSLPTANSSPRTAVMGSIRMPGVTRTSTFGVPGSATFQHAGPQQQQQQQQRTPSILSPGFQ